MPAYEELLRKADEAAMVLYVIEAHSRHMSSEHISTLAREHGSALKTVVDQVRDQVRADANANR